MESCLQTWMMMQMVRNAAHPFQILYQRDIHLPSRIGVPPLDSDDDDLEIDDTDDAENIQDEPMQEELIDHSIHCFEGHIDAVYSVAWSPTVPALVATGGSDDKTFLWRVGEDAYMETQGAVHELLGHTDTIGVISFSHDGSMLATGGMDGRVKIWNPLDGSCIRTLEGPGESIEWLKWHPRGNVILAGSADFTVWMWLAQTGACMQVFTGHAGPVTCGGFSSDGKIVLTGGGEGDDSLKLWDPKTGECKISVQGAHFHAAPLISLAIHMDSHIALTGSEDGTVKVVSIDNGRVLNTLVGQHNEDTSIEVVAFLPTLPLAATSGMDGKLVLWDVASWTARAVCEHPDVRAIMSLVYLLLHL